MMELITALALAVVIEGLLYAAFPEQMKRAIMVVLDTPESQIRWVALTLAAAGLIVLAWVRL